MPTCVASRCMRMQLLAGGWGGGGEGGFGQKLYACACGCWLGGGGGGEGGFGQKLYACALFIILWVGSRNLVLDDAGFSIPNGILLVKSPH